MATPEDIARLERIYENDQVVIEGPNLYVEEGRGLPVLPRLFMGDRKKSSV